jgi:hypothetical protein
MESSSILKRLKVLKVPEEESLKRVKVFKEAFQRYPRP